MAIANPDPEKRSGDLMRQLSQVMELPFILIVSVLILGGGGYLLDKKLHTSPAFTLVGGVLGFAGGMWDILKRLSRNGKRKGSGSGG